MNRRKSKFGDWLDERVGHRAWLEGIANRPVEGGAQWPRAIEHAILATLVVQALSGLVVMTVYAPTTTAAWASVHFLTYTQPGGWVARGLHHFTSHALIVLVGAHLGWALVKRAYAKPREIGWWLLLARVGLVLGLAVTGHVLPWDQPGYWARRVELNIVGMAPVMGQQLKEAAMAGPALGQLALTRFYALHVTVMPLLLAGVTLLHLAVERRARGAREAVTQRRSEPYFPGQAARDALATLLIVAAALALAIRAHGAPLGAPADPTSDFPARPEWFLLPMFMLRKVFHGAMEFFGTAGVPALLAGYVFALPWIDKKPGVKASRAALAPIVLAGVLGALAIAGSFRADAADASFTKAKAKADARAHAAIEIAKAGIPPTGPLDMLRQDPEVRGEDLFEKHCASCHVLGELGDKKKASAPWLDGWGTEAWILDMMHDPDGDTRFGKTPFSGMMPSVDVPSKDRKPDDPPFKPMPEDEKKATAAFLAALGDEPGEPAPPRDKAALEKGEKIVRERCTTCHLYKGEGDDSSQEYAPELAGYGSVAWVRAQVANPATNATYRTKALDEDLKKHMPRFDSELSPADIEIVARWTRAHARGVPLAAASATVARHE